MGHANLYIYIAYMIHHKNYTKTRLGVDRDEVLGEHVPAHRLRRVPPQGRGPVILFDVVVECVNEMHQSQNEMIVHVCACVRVCEWDTSVGCQQPI